MKKFIIIIFILFLSSCVKKSELRFKDQNQELILNIENNGENIQWNKAFTTILRFENINIDGTSLMGPIIKTKYISNNEMEIQMLLKRELVNEEDIRIGNIKLKVGFIGKNKKEIYHTFLIPVE